MAEKNTGMISWGSDVLDKIESPSKRMRALLTSKSITEQIAAVLPRHLSAPTMIQLFMAEAIRKPELYLCTPESLVSCLSSAAELGLPVSSQLGMFYVIPRKNSKLEAKYKTKDVREATGMIGYKGWLDMAQRSAQVKQASANVVYLDELKAGLFSYNLQPPEVMHKGDPLAKIDRKDDQIVLAYCVIELLNGGRAQCVLTRDEILKHRERSTAWKASVKYNSDSPWITDFAAMCRKTAIRALLLGGTVPLSREMIHGMGADPDMRDEPVKGPALITIESPTDQLPAHDPEPAPPPQSADVDPRQATPEELEEAARWQEEQGA